MRMRFRSNYVHHASLPMRSEMLYGQTVLGLGLAQSNMCPEQRTGAGGAGDFSFVSVRRATKGRTGSGRCGPTLSLAETAPPLSQNERGAGSIGLLFPRGNEAVGERTPRRGARQLTSRGQGLECGANAKCSRMREAGSAGLTMSVRGARPPSMSRTDTRTSSTDFSLWSSEGEASSQRWAHRRSQRQLLHGDTCVEGDGH